MDDALGYAGKKVVVTGSFSGMGGAAADILVNLGADVYGIDIKPSPNPSVTHVQCDLRDKDAIDAAVAQLPDDIQAVCSCAGLPGPPFSLVDTMLVNFVGGRHLIESLIPKLAPDGAVCCVSSNAGLGWQQNLATLMPLVTSDGFDAGKAWVEANLQTVGMGQENAYGFSKQTLSAWVAWRSSTLIKDGRRLNNINPGPTQTPMMPQFHDIAGKEMIENFLGPIARYSTPEEQAWPIVMLNSPHMSYVNGVGLATDGGFEGALFTGQIDLSALMPAAE